VLPCLSSASQKLAEREERERRRVEAHKAKEEAKRYPMDDLELLAELRQKAAETGECLLNFPCPVRCA
jgi:phage gp16-like protein